MKRKFSKVAGTVAAVILLLAAFFNPDLAIELFSGNSINTITDSPIEIPDEEGIKPGGYINAKVVRIVDGDTLEAEYQGKEYKVRLLCVDTPETKKSGVDVQPYGQEAAEKLKAMVLNKRVTLVFEKDVDDRYDRLLAYIFTEDGCCVNALLVEQGFARVDIVRPNDVHKEYFYELQDTAIENKNGLWALPENKRPFVKNDEGYYIPRYVDGAA